MLKREERRMNKNNINFMKRERIKEKILKTKEILIMLKNGKNLVTASRENVMKLIL